MVCFRFDNAQDRDVRKIENKAAAIFYVFQKIMQNVKKPFSIREYACIDEMLVGFRGKRPFRIYMTNKPVKHGMKFMALTDARNSYLYDAYIYSGK
ncbi:hypothetical protein AVEN_90413-1 [Araneus ventricosus]|uniref:PiggyBac transposable element-derived protein domain-containing protein n=1 Tax=Araneus ventricosus TaxID=182803 RepID=A0A4Y2GHU9_ARAVE|nr:hypothetical protein AVEN_90413-1 [Araneus ventricosus]